MKTLTILIILAVFVLPAFPCCIDPIRGDVNYDGGLDISDLVYLVEWMFVGGPEPPCFEEADIDGSGISDISDLLMLVDYFYREGPSPAGC